MKRLPASNLAHKHELGGYSEDLYWQYIVDSYDNGQFSQVKELFNKQEFHSQSNCAKWLEMQGRADVMFTVLNDKIETERQREFQNGY